MPSGKHPASNKQSGRVARALHKKGDGKECPVVRKRKLRAEGWTTPIRPAKDYRM